MGRFGGNRLFDGDFGQVREHVILEASWLGNFEPYTNESISCYVADMMIAKGQGDLVTQYQMNPFTVKVLSKERTLCEKIMSLVRFSRSENPIFDLSNKIRHICDIHMMLKNDQISSFFESEGFYTMLIKVGKDDIISYKNNNNWISDHPSSALIFDQPDATWSSIRGTYNTKFKEMVTGELPPEEKLVESIKVVAARLKSINWDLL